jgi:DNA-binding MarR family transcriptional regulator
MNRKQSPTQGPISAELKEVLNRQPDWLGFRMGGLGNYFTAPLYAEMEKRYGILKDEFIVLGNLYDCGSLSAKTICALTGRPKNSISRGVTRLLERGRIRGVVNENDRREMYLSLLAEGRKLYERLRPLCEERERLLMGGLAKDELAQLDRLLRKVLDHYHHNPQGLAADFGSGGPFRR